MDSDLTRLTVFFEAPFWVGVFERFEGGTLSVCKVTFGAEPKDYDVFSYVLKNYARLRFSPAVAAAVRQDAANPKRMQREIRRTSSGGVGTKAQQALQLQREEQKLERETRTRKQRDAEKQLKFDRRQQKRKAPGTVTVRPLCVRQCLYCCSRRGRIAFSKKPPLG